MDVDRMAQIIERVIDSLPMEQRLYPDLYARKCAEAIDKEASDE